MVLTEGINWFAIYAFSIVLHVKIAGRFTFTELFMGLERVKKKKND